MNRQKWKILVKKIKKSFDEEDRKEPFVNRFYVEETNRIFDLLLSDYGGFTDETDRAIFDIFTDVMNKVEVKE